MSEAPDDLARLDATAQAELVRSGQLKPVELVDAAIERLARRNPELNAVIHPALERARTRAAVPGPSAGPFHGVPFLMKDIGGEEAGQPAHAGMACLKQAGFRAAEDSWLTRRFVEAGLVSLGRTNTPELALLPTTEPVAYGATRNPWSLEHSAGGSSGGAAAAVAAGIVPAAHASDGGGSIRGPASMCGVVGLKPTRGRCSFGPALGERWSGFSCEFVVTRSVRDSAALLDAVAGSMPGDPYSAAPPDRSFASALAEPFRPLRIGLWTTAPRGIPTHPDAQAAARTCARRLEAIGHRVEEAHPQALDEEATVGLYVKVVTANVARALEVAGTRIGRSVGEADVEPLTWALAGMGRQLAATDLIATLESVHAFGRRLAAWWQSGFDLLLGPTQALPPPRIGEITSTAAEPLRAFLRAAPYGVFTLPFNLSGQPAISLPGHWSDLEGVPLPIGVQLVAPTGAERVLLAVAAQLEAAAPWADRLPPCFG
jgi:amidase